MELGVSFPSREIGNDPIAIRDYAQGVEALGYSYITLFGFLAGCTTRVILAAAVIVLPQRQTVLVAKQAAEVDVLSGGRMQMGAGIGRFWLEYESLGANFKDRAPRMDEQIAVLRALWTQQTVHIDGRWHKIIDQGINPLPIQRPIPIWMGGGRSDSSLRRIARLSDGWNLSPLTSPVPDEHAAADIARFKRYLADNGRAAAGFPIEAPFILAKVLPDRWLEAHNQWEALGVTHLGVRSVGNGFKRPDQHLELLRRYAEAVRRS